MHYPKYLLQLIESLKLFPGVGTKSAERFAFEMLGWNSSKLKSLSESINAVSEKRSFCADCGCLNEKDSCLFCTEVRIKSGKICVVSSVRDLFSIEKTKSFDGLYHVLGSLLSPLDGIGPEKLPLNSLTHRIKQFNIKEVIIALDATIDGDATALFLKETLQAPHLQVTRLAFGLPLGSSLDWVDHGTLARAVTERNQF